MGLLYTFFVIPVILPFYFWDKTRQERLIAESSVEWVIVRPGALTNGGKRGRARHGRHVGSFLVTVRISRADVAEFKLNQPCPTHTCMPRRACVGRSGCTTAIRRRAPAAARRTTSHGARRAGGAWKPRGSENSDEARGMSLGVVVALLAGSTCSSPSLVAREMVLNTGLSHGFFYRPLPEWVDPVVAWAGAAGEERTAEPQAEAAGAPRRRRTVP